MSKFYYGLSVPIQKTEYQKRKRFLERTVSMLEARLEKAPEGSLIVARKSRTKSPGFYHVKKGGKERVYLDRSHREQIALLAQKEYDRKALKVVKKELAVIDTVLAYCDVPKVEDVFGSCQEDKQEYIVPVVESDEHFRQAWLSQHYYRNRTEEGELLYPTERGDMVRSKSEGQQANYLFHHGYEYLYEKRLLLNDHGRKTYRYPDFTILDPVTRKEVIYEHLGMIDNPEYLQNNLKKLKLYLENGYVLGENLLITYETHVHPFTIDQLDRVLSARFGRPKS